MHSSVLTQPSAFTLEPLEPSTMKLDKHSYPDTSERPKFQVSPSRSVAGVKEAWILMLPWFTPLTQPISALIVVGFSNEVGYGDVREMRARLELMSPSFYCCTSIYIGASAGLC